MLTFIASYNTVNTHLSREELAHGIVGVVAAGVRMDGLLRPDVAEDFLTIAKELVE